MNKMIKTFDFEKMPIVEIVNEILVDSAKRGASDIHFDPQEKAMKVRIRVDGALTDYAEVPNAVKATLQDLDLDFRVSVLPISNGEKIVIRILDYTKSLNGIENLDFSESNFKKVLYMMGVPNGIILVTGAT